MTKDPQKRIQKIYEEHIYPELGLQKGEDYISISLSQEEFKDVCDFFAMFAYD